MSDIIFLHPEPPPQKHLIRPVFIPFAGCRERCVFCAQHAQTGAESAPLNSHLKQLETMLRKALALGARPFELAFYGGSFTALTPDWQARFITLAQTYRAHGIVTAIRCSTRPDCITPLQLATLRHMGLDTVELGIQSFCDEALHRSQRGYTSQIALEACSMVQQAGLRLGIQLLPGMPGQRDGAFIRDVRLTCSFTPDFARLYPCLVLQNTTLAQWWHAGTYTPWSLQRVLPILGLASGLLWQNHIRIIRTGVAYTPALTPHVLAGPYHPALGTMVRSEALLGLVRFHTMRLGQKASALWAPKRFQGEFWGNSRSLAARWAQLGLHRTTVHWWDKKYFLLR